jgi:hypothetical protein
MTSPAITSAKPPGAAKFASRFDRFQVGLLIVAALLTCGALVYGGFLLTVMQLAMIYAIFCIGLNFFMGYTGQAVVRPERLCLHRRLWQRHSLRSVWIGPAAGVDHIPW